MLKQLEEIDRLKTTQRQLEMQLANAERERDELKGEVVQLKDERSRLNDECTTARTQGVEIAKLRDELADVQEELRQTKVALVAAQKRITQLTDPAD